MQSHAMCCGIYQMTTLILIGLIVIVTLIGLNSEKKNFQTDLDIHQYNQSCLNKKQYLWQEMTWIKPASIVIQYQNSLHSTIDTCVHLLLDWILSFQLLFETYSGVFHREIFSISRIAAAFRFRRRDDVMNLHHRIWIKVHHIINKPVR